MDQTHTPERQETTPAGDMLNGLVRITLIILTVGGLVIFGLLWLNIQSRKEIAIHASEAMFSALLDLQAEELTRVNRDYAYWDDSISHLLITLDKRWANDNIGSYLIGNFGMTFTVVIDGKGKPLIGARGDDQLIDPPATWGDKHFNDIVAKAVAAAPTGDGPTPVTGLAMYDNALYLISASKFLTEEDTTIVNPDPDAVLVIGRLLDPTIFAYFGPAFGMNDLRLSAPDLIKPNPESAVLPLVAADGTVLATATWQPALQKVTFGWEVLIAMLGVFIAISSLLIAFLHRARMLARNLLHETSMRTREQQELAQRREQVGAVAAYAPVTLLSIDQAGCLTQVEGAEIDHIALQPITLGQPLAKVLPCHPPLSGSILQALAGATIEKTVTLGEFYLAVTLAPRRTADGAVVGVLGVLMDITERQRAEASLTRTLDELTRSNAELERFAYIASHDLQEPIRTVVAFTQLLERKLDGSLTPEVQEYMRFITDGALRMRGLVLDLLQYSRVGATLSCFSTVNAVETMKAALANLHQSISASGGTVTLPTEQILVNGDATLLMELFQNLVSNALKFTHPSRPPQVTITAYDDMLSWRFAVTDNGIGIDPIHANSIFEVFKRLHTIDVYPGTGMGLAICKRIVERHGGTIWLDTATTEGTSFRFTLPKAHHDSLSDPVPVTALLAPPDKILA